MSREEAIEILSDMRAEYSIFGDEEEATRYHVLSWAIQEMKATQQKISPSDIEEAVEYIKNAQEYLRDIGETWCANYLSDAIDLLVGERGEDETDQVLFGDAPL